MTHPTIHANAPRISQVAINTVSANETFVPETMPLAIRQSGGIAIGIPMGRNPDISMFMYPARKPVSKPVLTLVKS